MGLETATYPNGLNASWPLGTDPKSQGDDHLRLLKTVIKDVFPAGYNDAPLPVLLDRFQTARRVGRVYYSFPTQTDLTQTKSLLGTTADFVATSVDLQALMLGTFGVASMPANTEQAVQLYCKLRNISDAVDGEEAYDLAKMRNWSGSVATSDWALKIAVQYNWVVTVGKVYRFNIYGNKLTGNGATNLNQLTVQGACLT